jgi:hypothetical protein
MPYNTLVYFEQGGSRGVVASGGSFDVESGGEIDIESGGALKLAGTAITSTAAELNILDGVTATAAEINVLAGVTGGTVTASKAVVVDGSKNIATLGTVGCGAITTSGLLGFTAAGGTAAANALLMGIGTSGDPATTATAGKIFAEFRCQTTATSGDNRLLYMRYDINGAGAGGESLRSFTKLTAAASTARGAHISLDLGNTSGSVTGAGYGLDGQILWGNTAYTAGTYACLNLEQWADGTSTDISGVTKSSFIRATMSNDATGVANIEDNTNFIELVGGTVAAGNLFAAKTASAVSHGLRCNIYGTTYYLMVSDTQ